MEPAPLDVIVVIFSAIVVSTQIGESGDECWSFNECCSRALYSDIKWEPYHCVIIESNLLWAYLIHFEDKHRFIEASFRFYSKRDNLTVKKCGVHLI